MPIKIAYIIDQLSIGGTEKQLVELVNRIDPGEFTPVVFLLRARHDDLTSKLRCQCHVLDIESLYRPSSLRKFLRFLHILCDEQFSILQTFFPESCFVGSLAGRLARIPVVIATRRDIGYWHNVINRFYLSLSNRFIDHILANSKAVKIYTMVEERVPAKKIEVIYNGINTKFYSPDNLARQNLHNDIATIGIISNFARPVKRFDIFLESTRLLLEDYGRLNFLVVGDVSYQTKTAIPDLLLPFFSFTGIVEDVRPFLKQMDVGVISSDSEGFCNVLLEYMASGVPCVASKTGGNIELIRDGVDGFLFSVSDSQALAGRISQLLDDESIRKQFILKSLAKVQKSFDWASILVDYETYYKRLLTSKLMCHE